MSRIVNICEKYKDVVGLFTSIFTAFGVISVLIFSMYTVYLAPILPLLDIQVSHRNIDKGVERVVIYNGGNGPCNEMYVSYKDVFQQVLQVHNYDDSWLTNTEYRNGILFSKPRVTSVISSSCKGQDCEIDAGVLKQGRTLTVEFVKNPMINISNKQIEVSCINTSKSVTIFKQ